MKARWIDTDDYYRQILAAPDQAARHERYVELLVKPWKPMMDMMSGMFAGDSADPLAGARAWNWLLPQDLAQEPAALRKLRAAGAWKVGREALARGVAAFEPFASRIPFDAVSGWLVLADPARADPIQRGYSGAADWTQPRFVVQYDTPDEANLRCLPGVIVHELQHLVRFGMFPWDMMRTRVADYIVYEGTAESLAAELYGPEVVGYYVTEFDEAQFETARQLVREGLDRTGFDVIRGYIFGDSLAEQWHFEKIGMPDYGGYALGYRIVQAFLARSGKRAAEATFLPADEIIEGSGFFE